MTISIRDELKAQSQIPQLASSVTAVKPIGGISQNAKQGSYTWKMTDLKLSSQTEV